MRRMERPLEQLAQTTEPQMVQRRFDEQNLVWAYLISWLFALASLVLVPASFAWKQQRLAHAGVSIIDALLTLFLIASMSELRRARRRNDRPLRSYARIVDRNLSAWLVALFAVKFAALVFFALTDKWGWVAWGFVFPVATIALRLLLPQRILLNGALLAVLFVAFLGAPASRNKTNPVGIAITLVSINVACFVIGALLSSSIKKSAIEEGVQRRAEAREQLRIRDELRFAREVQISMLPEAPPQIEWADVAGVSLPATEVGGDYYDYFIVDGRLAIVCGDVAGHGLASGITLSALRSGFTLLRDQLLDPAHVLDRLQEVVAQSSRRRMMVTISVLLLDHETHLATIASAGHPPLLHVRGATRETQLIELFAPPLGARLGATVPQRVVPFASGDTFVLHSDGIYETVNASGDEYGLDRLARIVAACDGTAEEVRDVVLRDVESFRGDEPQEDDVTLVVVRIG
ncbi:MAG: phosphoserine phosphatase RsbU/P [Thermoanaerobaculia bacterium]|jgi:serine phosphatase RsbU (regulator of sigma subunit)|nr:phosphoserine phosphatase RsbU/P [Thermoanaerobaculia bacterium]